MRLTVLPLALLTLAAPAAAQKKQAPRTKTTTTTTVERRADSTSVRVATGGSTRTETGAFLVRLGSDTVAAEQYTRTGNRIVGDVVSRSPMARVTHYVVTLDDAGRPARIEWESRRPDGAPLPNAALSAALTFKGDSVWRELKFADSTSAGVAAAVPGTILSLANSYAMYELALAGLRAAKADSGAINLYAPGAPRSQPLAVTFRGDTATLNYFGDPILLRLDPTGRILSVDGSRSTNKSMVERLAAIDVKALAGAFAAAPAMGPASPRDSVRATVGATRVAIDYSRPSKRGRTVWGGTLVPYGQVWRTGANAATMLTTSTDVTIGGATIPAGKYTLWTVPSAQGYQLVVNKQTGQWGTEYDAKQDLVRIPLTATTLAQPVEQFQIAVEPAASGSQLVLRWDTLQLSAPIAPK